jgi:hypothetical protein
VNRPDILLVVSYNVVAGEAKYFEPLPENLTLLACCLLAKNDKKPKFGELIISEKIEYFEDKIG